MWTSHYHSVQPKYANYSANGTGRDTYINFNNGGYFCPSVKNPGNKRGLVRPMTASISISAKSLRYQADGTGRDAYVAVTDGGLHSPVTRGAAQFHNTLRSYPLRPLSGTFPCHSSKKLLRERSERVRDCIARLYPGSN